VVVPVDRWWVHPVLGMAMMGHVLMWR